MKKIIIVILFFTVVASVFSCKPETESGDTMRENIGNIKGEYIFQNSFTRIKDFRPLLKYNVHTGDCSTVCPDLFCSHNDENCFFYGISYFTYIGDTLFFERMDKTNGKYGIFSFNVDTDEGDFIYHQSIGRIGAIYSYYYDLYFETGNTVYKLDTRTNKVKDLSAPDRCSIYLIRNNTIMWRKEGDAGSKFIMSDLDGKNQKEVDNYYRYGKYIYLFRQSENNSSFISALDLFRSTDNENWVKIAECIGPGVFVDDRILYFEPSTDINGFASKGMYSMAPDGSDVKLLMHNDDIALEMTSPNRFNEMICGDYIGIIISPKTPINDETECYPDCNLLILNYRTGEYVVSWCPYG